jgi:hypothetical protein
MPKRLTSKNKQSEEWCVTIAYPNTLSIKATDSKIRTALGMAPEAAGCMLGPGGSRDMEFYFNNENAAKQAIAALMAVEELTFIEALRTTSWIIRGSPLTDAKDSTTPY